MSYATGTAASANALLDAFRLFAVADGWTINQWSVDGTGQRLHLSKGSIFANLNSRIYSGGGYSEFGLYLSTGYTPGLAWTNGSNEPLQPGFSPLLPVGGNYLVSLHPCTYTFFGGTNPDALYVSCLSNSGLSRVRFGFGEIIKYGSWAGGQFLCLPNFTYSPPDAILVRADLPWVSQVRKWVGSGNIGATNGIVRLSPPGDALNSFNGLSPLLPIRLGSYDTGSKVIPLGFLPHVRAMRRDSIPAWGSTLTIGSDEWVVTWDPELPSYSSALVARK